MPKAGRSEVVTMWVISQSPPSMRAVESGSATDDGDAVGRLDGTTVRPGDEAAVRAGDPAPGLASAAD